MTVGPLDPSARGRLGALPLSKSKSRSGSIPISVGSCGSYLLAAMPCPAQAAEGRPLMACQALSNSAWGSSYSSSFFEK